MHRVARKVGTLESDVGSSVRRGEGNFVCAVKDCTSDLLSSMIKLHKALGWTI